jgi:hypothetical protein
MKARPNGAKLVRAGKDGTLVFAYAEVFATAGVTGKTACRTPNESTSFQWNNMIKRMGLFCRANV